MIKKCFLILLVTLIASFLIFYICLLYRAQQVSSIIPNNTFSVECKIDLVYTWVDGSDPNFQLKKYQRVISEKRVHTSHELYYSIKAARKYLGDMLGTIYVVTDNQNPHTLPEHKHPENVVWINHDDIFPDYVTRPCFNSNVIEMFLHRIPNLSEYFLYSCDDMFFFNHVDYSYVFIDESRKLRFHTDGWGLSPQWANKITLGQETTTVSRCVSDTLLNEKLGISKYPRLLLAHAPIIVQKSVFRDMCDQYFATEIKQSATHQFRQKDDLVLMAYIWPHFATQSGLGQITRDFHSVYVHVNDWEWLLRFQLNRLDKLTYHNFVLNDSRSKNFEATDKILNKWLEQKFS